MFAISVEVIFSVSENSSGSMVHKLNTSEYVSLSYLLVRAMFALYLSITSLKICFALMSFIAWDDIVSQCLKFGTAFLSSSWESKIALFF